MTHKAEIISWAYNYLFSEGTSMTEPEIIPPQRTYLRSNGWVKAYFEFIRNPSESRTLKLMPLILIGVVPISILNNLILPVIGNIDDIPTTVLTIFIVVVTVVRVRTYR